CSNDATKGCNLDSDCGLGNVCNLNDATVPKVTIVGACSNDSSPCTSDSECTGGVCNVTDIQDVDLGHRFLSAISGTKYDHASHLHDPTTSPGIGNVKVTLTGTTAEDNAPVSKCTATASDGTYTFGSLVAGTYTVTETPPPGSVPTGLTTCNVN